MSKYVNAVINSNIKQRTSNMTVNIRGPWENMYLLSFFAGIALGIAGTVYLSVLAMFGITPIGKLIGAILFSFGLITIRRRGWWLYTGAVGITDLSNQSKKKRYFIMGLFGNVLALWLVSYFAININPDLVSIADTLVVAKLAMPWWRVLTASFACGLCMFFACTTSADYMTAFPVIIFILCGFEHVLADFFYICIRGLNVFDLNTLKFLILALIGNSAGANIIRVLNGTVGNDVK